MSKLKGDIIDVTDLTAEQKDRIFQLMSVYYSGVNAETFSRDLLEKQWILILSDSSGKIQGFTTLMIISHMVSKVELRCVFSGDTIIDDRFRGELELMKVWLKFVINYDESHDGGLFWFLISKGYRTYKLLPLFFREFYPRFDQVMPPDIKIVMDKFSLDKFPNEYDCQSGIITPDNGDYLRTGKDDISEHHLKDPHVKFFAETNPFFWKGNELVCLARLSRDNLNKFGRRLISR